ncbi:hypothetical protein [Kitasatospora sp. McL0602]|uniref:hypothetical protein n=1 Tax=Kitasatospora sp. McL0602 TaxID=3439530 RepID=UPI003F8CEE80
MNAPEEPPAASPPAAPPPAGPQPAESLGPGVHNHFHGQVNAAGAHFGTGAEQPTGRRSNTGNLSEAEVGELLVGYVRPAPYEEALGALHRERVVLLTGPAGTGKRSGAVNLLREVTSGPLRLLSPVLAADELAKAPYERGWGYALLNRTEELAGGEPQDFGWRQVRDQVLACGAYLVVTARAERFTPGAPSSLTPVRWAAPDPVEVLRTALGHAGCDGPTVELALLHRHEDATPRELARIAGRIADGEPPEQVWAERTSALDPEVTAWFEARPEPRPLLSVVALAFVPGAGERDFERVLSLLRSALEREGAGEDGPAEGGETTFRPLRAELTTEGGLITTTRLLVGALPRNAVVFRRAAHRAQVLRELWQRYHNELWDGVRRWLGLLVEAADPAEDAELQVSVAAGLALLARAAFEEVLTQYLWPWTGRASTPAERLTAVYTLWWMAMDDEVAAAALDIARRCACDRDPMRRGLAALVFGGELGVRFPAEAVRWIWHVAGQEPAGEVLAVEELGRLFAGLVDYGEDTQVVLGVLRSRAARFIDRPYSYRPRELARQAALAVLEAESPRGGSTAAGLLLGAEPASEPARRERAELLADLWAPLLRALPTMGRARRSLFACLRTVDRSGADPQGDLGLIGGELEARLSPREWQALVLGLQRLAAAPAGRLGKGEALRLLDALQRAGTRPGD